MFICYVFFGRGGGRVYLLEAVVADKFRGLSDEVHLREGPRGPAHGAALSTPLGAGAGGGGCVRKGRGK